MSALEAATIDDVIGHIISEGTGLTHPQAMAYFERLSQFDPKDVQQDIFFILEYTLSV